MDKTETPDDMLPGERRDRLIEWFSNNVSASNQELSRLFNASVSTIRRDLDALASEGFIRRTHGGAVRIRRSAAFEPSVEEARQTAVEEKQAICAEAVKRLEPGQSIIIDTSSTLHQFAHAVAELTIPLTVVTSDIYVAGVLSFKPNIALIVPGGTCRPSAYTLLGEPGLSFMQDISCDRFFMCAQGIDQECISDTYIELVQLKRVMMAAAQKTTLLIDSSKFETRTIYRIAPVRDIDEIITDEGLPEEAAEQYEALGIPTTRVALSQE